MVKQNIIAKLRAKFTQKEQKSWLSLVAGDAIIKWI